ncbi:lecithin retinol acyltransferase family protein [Nostoc sp.]|uniref:lecithin retinol acyltransferase family protein n=1 Tax=Nostoc sp. TaxID=1180 RepID=UPI002FF76724
MVKGDHIYIWKNGNTYTHHGIDCGEGTVIHYDGQRICLVSKTAFAEGKTIHVKEYGKCDADEIVVQRAKTRLGEDKYSRTSNNCEHFAYYCKTGNHKSEQVNRVAAAGGGAAALIVGGGAAIAVGVAAPAVLGIGAALGAYHFGKENKK